MAIVSRYAGQLTTSVRHWTRRMLPGSAHAACNCRLPARLSVLIAAIAAGALTDRVALHAQTIGTFTWSHNGDKLEVSCRGDVEFSDDDLDVKSLTPGGVLRVTERRPAGARTIEVAADAAGQIERRFSVETSGRPYATEGRKWLSQILPPLIRHTGIGASGRVARILRTNGSAGVLTEISLIEGSWAKRLYFDELLNTPWLDSRTRQQSLTQAARQMDSEPELTGLLAAHDALLRSEDTRPAYLEAAQTIGSDFEKHRLFATVLARGPIDDAALAGVLAVSASIGSDVELASLLVQVARLQPLDETTRQPFFKALDTLIASHAEHGRVLAAVLEQPERSPEVAAAVLASASTLRSDNETARLLALVAARHAIEGLLRPAFFKRVASVSSPFERSHVLQIVARRKGASEETIMAVLRAVQGMTASYEAAQVLLAVAETQTLSGPARGAYIDAAKNLGTVDRRRTVTALEAPERLD